MPAAPSSSLSQRFNPYASSDSSSLQPTQLSTPPSQNLALLETLGLTFNDVHKVIICLTCQCGWKAGSLAGHLARSHGIRLSPKEKDDLQSLLAFLDVDDTRIITVNSTVPIENLAIVDDAYLCVVCSYCSLSLQTLMKHFTDAHKQHHLKGESRYTRGSVQTIFKPSPIQYFRVERPPITPESINLYDVFVSQELPRFSPLTQVLPQNAREIPPLLTCTQWHLHLAPYIETRLQRESIKSLTEPPIISDDNPLWIVTYKYLNQIRIMSDKASFRCRILLMECPRVSINAKAWAAHKNISTLKEYGRVLYNFAYSTLASLRGHPSSYRYPFSEDMIVKGNQLFMALESGNPIDVDDFHAWIYPFLAFHHHPHEANKWSMVLECWLAIYNFHREGHFSAPSDVAPLLAKVVYHIRGATLYEAFKCQAQDKDNLHEVLENLCMQNLKPGSFTPFNVVVEYQRFTSALALGQSHAPSTDLSPDATQVSYRDKTMDVATWKLGMRAMYNDCASLVDDLLADCPANLTLPNSLVDDMANNNFGYSWLETAAQHIHPHTLLKHLMACPDVAPCTLTQSGELQWNTHRQIAFVKKSAQIVELLAALHHTVPGQPCRIAELCDFRIRNGLRGRNIFRSHDADWFVTRRVKSETLVQHEEFVPVKLPPEFTSLLHRYLLLIRPVEILFARIIWNDSVANLYNEYLYVKNGKRLMEDVFYGEFKNITEKYFQVRIGARGYRQMVITLARAYLGSEYELDVEEEQTDSLIEQRNHGAAADRRCYGIQSQYLHTISSDVMFRFGRISEYWWRLTGFAPGLPPLLPLDKRRQFNLSSLLPSSPKSTVVVPSNSSISPPALPLPQPADLAMLLGASLQSIIQESMLPKIQSFIRQEIAAGIAELQMRHGHSAPVTSLTPVITAAPSNSTPSVTEITSPEQSVLTPAQDALYWLRAMLDNPTATFRSQEQAELTQIVFSGSRNVVGILPTGGGKSYIFLIPAYADQVQAAERGSHETPRKTLTVIPNKALLADMLRKATDLGVRAIQWTTSTSNLVANNASLLLVALESITSPKFKEFYRKQEGKVARICLDESHQMLISEEYRSKFAKLGELAQYDVQRIFLSATLPPSLMDHFLTKNYLPNSTLVIRAPTFRPNLRYHVLWIEERIHKMADVTKKLALQLEASTFSPYSRGIIFCNSIREVDEIATNFHNVKSHSQMDSAERAHLQEVWFMGGTSKWMVATTGWLHGIDHPNVDAVIFNNLPYGLLNFSQGAGRAGRSGQEANVFLLHSTHQQWLTPGRDTLDVQLLAPVDDFVRHEICHVKVLTMAMDGESEQRSCNDIRNAMECDVCNPDHPITVAAKSLLTIRECSPDYDLGGWDETSLMQLDDSLFSQPALATPPMTRPATPNPSSRISIQVDSARYNMLIANKRGKVAEWFQRMQLLYMLGMEGKTCTKNVITRVFHPLQVP
ncbi:hypothetical protein H0H93_000226 [Arthromyces matolae]|nr:hypothetical protein H0H93_000226 [Arthromyces matolae]